MTGLKKLIGIVTPLDGITEMIMEKFIVPIGFLISVISLILIAETIYVHSW